MVQNDIKGSIPLHVARVENSVIDFEKEYDCVFTSTHVVTMRFQSETKLIQGTKQ